MQLQLNSIQKKGAAGTLDVSDYVFAQKFNEDLVHQLVTAYMARGRQGTRAQKNRAAVRGGGKKPWNQKGGGRARAGTTRSPIWRKGGVTFAAQPQDYTQKVNKKMYRTGMRSVLSELARQDRLVIVDSLQVDTRKTKDFIDKLSQLGIKDALLVVDSIDENLFLASRNIPAIDVCDVMGINPANLIAFEKVLFTVPALKQVEEILG